MTPSALLAEKIRETTATKTDYATARALGVSQSYLKQVLLGNRNFGPEACVRASETLRQPLAEVLAEIELSKAQTPEKKAFWEKRRPRLLPSLALWLTSGGVTYVTLCGLSTAQVVRQLIHYAQWRSRMRMIRIFPRVAQG